MVNKVSNMVDENEIVKQYIPLINKIASQISKVSGYSFEECISAGYEGILYAIRNYKEGEGKKKQTFTQYAAYMVRFFILNSMNRFGHIIRVNQDQQKRLKKEGKNTDITLSLDRQMRGCKNEEGDTFVDMVPGDDEKSVYSSLEPSEEDQWNIVFRKLSVSFSERDIDIFYSTFGVNGQKELSGKDVAVKYGISAGAVTQVRNKIIKYMRENKELREILLDILNR